MLENRPDQLGALGGGNGEIRRAGIPAGGEGAAQDHGERGEFHSKPRGSCRYETAEAGYFAGPARQELAVGIPW